MILRNISCLFVWPIDQPKIGSLYVRVDCMLAPVPPDPVAPVPFRAWQTNGKMRMARRNKFRLGTGNIPVTLPGTGQSNQFLSNFDISVKGKHYVCSQSCAGFLVVVVLLSLGSYSCRDGKSNILFFYFPDDRNGFEAVQRSSYISNRRE
jgi:hypothetical protein